MTYLIFLMSLMIGSTGAAYETGQHWFDLVLEPEVEAYFMRQGAPPICHFSSNDLKNKNLTILNETTHFRVMKISAVVPVQFLDCDPSNKTELYECQSIFQVTPGDQGAWVVSSSCEKIND